jgi:hypothetical protein
MAGAGYKLFNTGDVLTAAQVNTYLMQQTVMVFANASARTTALSGVLAEGMMSYLQDTNAVEKYDGSSWSAIGDGDISEVLAGTGLSGGGSSGSVTLSYDYAAGSKFTAIDEKTANYTPVAGDAAQKLITVNSTSDLEITIPTNGNVAFATGTVLNFLRINTGKVTIKAVTPATTTINSTGATATAPELRARYSAASAIKTATDTWYVVGDLT